MLSNTKPIPTRHDLACNICGDTSGDCREIEAGWLCHGEIDGFAPVPDYKYLRSSKCGVWGVWVPAENSFSADERSQWAERKRLHQQQHRAESLAVDVRDRHYKDLLNELVLNDEDLKDLLRRGFTEQEAWDNGYRSIEQWQSLDREYLVALPGIGKEGRSLLNYESGYICPCRNEDGLISGLQYRRRADGEGGRYRWLSSSKFASVNLPNGEPPLSIFKADSPVVGFAEGTGPKPHLLSLREGINVIGASGRSWPTSVRSLRSALKSINPKQCILYPDAGADEHTVRQYRRLYDLLKSWGWVMAIAWWGQSTKVDGDIDEISEQQRSEIHLIDWRTYEKYLKGLEA